MGASNEQVVEYLVDAVDSFADAVGSGRLGFDYAVKEYVEQTDNELSRAFAGYVEAMVTGPEAGQSNDDVRRSALLRIARQFNSPEVTAFVDALIESMDKRLSLVPILERQARQLHKI
jgi:hypothetical protein